MKLRPLQDRVLIKATDDEQKTKGGIIDRKSTRLNSSHT